MKFMVSGVRDEVGWGDVVELVKTREFTGAPELGVLRAPAPAPVLKPREGVYHRVAPGAKMVTRREAVS